MKHHTRGEVALEALGIFCVFAILFIVVWGFVELGRSGGQAAAYRAFRDGRAQVIKYTVPGSGKCRAVLIDGERKAEACGDR